MFQNRLRKEKRKKFLISVAKLNWHPFVLAHLVFFVGRLATWDWNATLGRFCLKPCEICILISWPLVPSSKIVTPFRILS